jgi:hypothetical protein
MGQGDPGRQYQAAGMRSRPKTGKTFHNVSFGESRAGLPTRWSVDHYNPRTSFAVPAPPGVRLHDRIAGSVNAKSP